MATDDDLTLEKMLCFSLYAAVHAMNRVYKPLLEKLGLTYPQYLVMVTLWQEDGRTVKALGEDLFLDSGTLTPLLKRLEGLGLVRRQRNPDDEREVHIHLTEKGTALRSQARAIPAKIAAATGCSLPELRELTGEIRQLRAHLDRHARAFAD